MSSEMSGKTFGVIDCGSHSTRLLVARDNPENILQRDVRVTKLGEGVEKSGQLNEEAMKRTLDCIGDYEQTLAGFKPDGVWVTATAAARKAENFKRLFDQVEELISVRPILLSGEEEAALTFSGATHCLGNQPLGSQPPDFQPPYLTVDIGGGSTEFGFGSEVCEAAVSLPIGSVNLTETHIKNDPALPEELYSCLSVAEAHLIDIRQTIPLPESAKTLIGMAGTATTAAAVELGFYDYDKVHHFLLTREALEDVFRTLSLESREARLANPGLHPDRVDVIVAGLTILVKTMRFFDFQDCLISERDLMDGTMQAMFEGSPLETIE